MRMGNQLPPYPIKLKAVVERLGVSQRALGRAAKLSAAAVNTLLNNNVWPAKANRTQIKADLRAAIHQAGATSIDLTQAFDPVVQIQPAPPPMQKVKRPTTPGKESKAASRHPTKPISKESNRMLAKRSLTREAMTAFELFSNPFDGEVTTAEEMFNSADIRYVREACWQAAMHGRFVAIVGESGAGKTTMLGDLEERILAEGRKVKVIKPSVLGMEDSEKTGKMLKASQILDSIIMTLDGAGRPKQSMEAKTRQVQELLEHSAKGGYTHLLVLEEAHGTPVNTLRHLKRMHEMRMGRKPLLGILLVAQPELKKKLSSGRHDLREVVQRCELVELAPINGDLKVYLNTRLARAGKNVTDVFENDQAVEAVRKRLTHTTRTGGNGRVYSVSLVYPLAVNNLVTAAMNEAAALGVPKLNEQIILAV